MTVIARDKAPTDWLLGACSFRIVVEDVNDNPPIFDQAVSPAVSWFLLSFHEIRWDKFIVRL